MQTLPGPPARNGERDLSEDGGRLGELGADIVDPQLLDVLVHWDEARAGATLPARDAIQPVKLTAVLPKIWIYQRRGEDFECVLAGEEVHQAWGDRVTHRRLSDLLGTEFATVRDRWLMLLSTPAITHGVLVLANSEVTIERLVLPLADGSGTPAFVLGVSSYQYDRLRNPGRVIQPRLETMRLYATDGSRLD